MSNRKVTKQNTFIGPFPNSKGMDLSSDYYDYTPIAATAKKAHPAQDKT